MEKTIGNKIKLGIFVVIGILLFMTGIYFIGQKQQLFSSTFQISAIFKDISGLQVGNNVRFSGINIGIIKNIDQITDSTVKVEMQIDEGSRKFIKKNAKAIVGSDGLMGNKIIQLIPGSVGQSEIEHNDIIETVLPVTMDDILIKIKVTADNAAIITHDLAAIMENIRNGKGTIGKLFMDTVFAKNLDQSIRNIKNGTKGFEQNMDAAQNSFLLRGALKKEKRKKEKDK